MLEYGAAGMFAGGLIGYKLGSDAAIRDRNPELGALAGAVLVGLGSLVPGVILGSSQSYLLNEKDSETLRYFQRFGIIAGITSSTLQGGFSDNRNFTARSKEQYIFGIYYLWKINNLLELRPEIIYCLKGGNYDYPNPPGSSLYFEYSGTSALYISMIEIPVLVQLELFAPENHFMKIFAGPSINVPVKSELDEFNVGPMDELSEFSVKKFNAAAYFGFIYGLGIKLDRHFSAELLFDEGLSGMGSADMHDGTRIRLLQNDFLICTTFSL